MKTTNRLTAACDEFADRRSREQANAAARFLAAGGTATEVVYPTGLRLVRVSCPKSGFTVEITPEQHRYLVKWNFKIGPNFPI
jgi:hypothetical protein